MQNYEELYTALLPAKKTLKDAAAAAVKQQKAMDKNADTGNLAEMKKAAAAAEDALAQMRQALDEINAQISAFDTQAYFMDGDFTSQLLACCKELEIDVKGEKGVYEMFPFKIRVLGDEEHPSEVYMDRKKVYSFRPSYIAETIKASQTKLYSANFKDSVFMNELAEAYDTALKKEDFKPGKAMPLTKVYKFLAPTARAKKEYDNQAFAFDLARLYALGPDHWISKNGTEFDFGTSRDGSGIRVLSRSGVESYISTINSKKTLK